MDECMMGREEKSASTDRIDSWLTHPVFGVPIFLGIMALVFFLTFTVGDFLKGYFETAFAPEKARVMEMTRRVL